MRAVLVRLEGLLVVLALAWACGCVQATAPWINPFAMRCWTLGETQQFYNPCTYQAIGGVKILLSWERIETNLVANADLQFQVRVAVEDPTNPEDPPLVTPTFYACREGAYNCDPTRSSKDFRLATIIGNTTYANGTIATFNVSTPYAERHTFVASVTYQDVLYYIGVTRDVMSGQGLTNAIQEATCTLNVAAHGVSLSLRMKKVESGLEFKLENPNEIPENLSYLMHVHETGDTRSFAHALGHFFGASVRADKKYEAGQIYSQHLVLNSSTHSPFVDPDLDFTGTNGILGRSLVLHNASDNVRLSQCLVSPVEAASSQPVPDWDATICVFSNGDVIHMETDNPFSSNQRILLRYIASNVATGSQDIVHKSSGKSLLSNLPLGTSTGKRVWTPVGNDLKWYDIELGSLLQRSTNDVCAVSRASPSGVFKDREFPPVLFGDAPLSRAVTSASCMFNNATSGVAGQIVFTRVSGETALCNTAAATYANCVRMDYFFAGLPTSQGAFSFRQFGLLSDSPLFEGLSLSCGDMVNCAEKISAPARIYPINPKAGTTHGLLFGPNLALSGVNSLLGRAIYLHTELDPDAEPIAKCVVAAEAAATFFTAPISQQENDNPDRATCEFVPSQIVSPNSRILFHDDMSQTIVVATIDLEFETDEFFNDRVELQIQPLLKQHPGYPQANMSTLTLEPNDEIIVTKTEYLSNIASVRSLFGATLSLVSDKGDLVATCVVGLARATPAVTLVPTTASPVPPTPPTTQAPSSPPTLRPAPFDPSAQPMSAGGYFVLFVLVLVLAAFFCVAMASIRRCIQKQRERLDYAQGIGEWGDYPGDSNADSTTVPLKPPKPAAAAFSSSYQDDEEQGLDEVDISESRHEQRQSTASVSVDHRKSGI